MSFLTSITYVLILIRLLRMSAVFSGFETANKYKIKNGLGQTVFLAAEDTDCCTRQICGPMRPFGIKIMDNAKNEIMHVERPLACDSCLCPCWRQVKGEEWWGAEKE